MLSPQWLDELRARVTLSTVVMRTTKLQRAGREWKACCPFHGEKTPSFYVNDQKGFYHCFGCQQHGDVIRWMTDQRGLGFMDAVKELAAEAGLEMPAPDPRAAERAEQRAGLADVTAEAQEWFVRNLRSSDGASARAYLERRGFDEATTERFGFGYASADRQALKDALSGFEEALLVEAGMRVTTDEPGRENYDRFRSRIMLPIQDARGRVIGFGGRILDAEASPKAPKYLNSPDTPLFDKGRNLYNLHRAAPASRKTGRLIVVEGYMDVIALAAAGIEDAVAPMGTALTEGQIELLWRHVETPVLCFDGDAAGQRAAVKAVERVLPLLKPGKTLRFVKLPNGLDPDDIIQRQGAEGFQRLISNPASLIDVLWETERVETSLTSPESTAHLRQRLIERSFAIEDHEIRKLYRRELLDKYHELIKPSWRDLSKRSQAHGLITQENLARLQYFVEGGSRELLCRAVFSALARHPDLIEENIEELYKYVPQDSEVKFALVVFYDAVESRIDGTPIGHTALAEIASWSNPIDFPFLASEASEESVSRSVKEAISILIDRPVIRRELAKATAEYGRTMSDEALKYQTYWRRRWEEVQARLIQFREQMA